MGTCNRCGYEGDGFYVSRPHRCKRCLRDARRDRRATPAGRRATRAERKRHADRRREYVREWRAANRDRDRVSNLRNQRRRRLGHDPDAADYADVLRGDPCCYCGSATEAIGHIEPLDGGGTNDWGNLTASCRACNSSKGTRPLLIALL